MAGFKWAAIPQEQEMVRSVDQRFSLDRFFLCQLRQNTWCFGVLLFSSVKRGYGSNECTVESDCCLE